MGLKRWSLRAALLLACGELAEAQCPPRELLRRSASDAAAQDQFGYALALDGDTALASAPYNGLFGQAGLGAVYVLERNLGGPGAWGERARLTPADIAPQAFFGLRRVALEGDIAVVRRNWDPLTLDGSLYVFERDLGGPHAWGQRTKLDGGGATNSTLAGSAFALDGDRLAVWLLGGTPGASFGRIAIFERHLGGANQWGLRLRFALPDAPVSSATWFTSLALDGDRLAVGTAAPYERVHLFERNLGGADAWGHAQTILAPSPVDTDFGWSVALASELLFVGAPLTFVPGASQSGAVQQFERNTTSGLFELVRQLAPNAPIGDARFGASLALNSNRCVVGAPGDDEFGAQTGSAWVFERDVGGTGAWGLRARVLASDASSFDNFGASLALDGATFLSGAPTRSGPGPNAGSLYVLEVLDWAPPASYCTAGTSLNGCSAQLSASGLASASASSGFVVSASGVDGARSGLVYYGLSGPLATPFAAGSSSYRCVAAPYQRTPVLSSNGVSGICNGSLSLDWNAYRAGSPLALGAPFLGGESVWIQAWWRDSGAPGNAQLSNGLSFSVCH
jgi:hypothetical protein